MMAKENTVCALVRLSKNKEEDKVMIGRVGAILHLLKLLEGGGLHGKKNSVTVRYALCSTTKENKVKAVSTGVMRALVELMVDLGLSMEDLGLSMVYLVSVVVAVAEAKGIYDFQLQALVAEVRDLRDREHSATEQHHLLVQKLKRNDEECGKRIQELQDELASAKEDTRNWRERQNFVNAYEVVLDLDETLVCAFETSSLPAALWTQAIEGGLNCLQLVLKAMLDPLLTE
ncbi:U-box domain-containing protein 13 [Glycine soja]